MPGELGDEFDGPYVGYYEKRYVTLPDWGVDQNYGNLPGRPKLNKNNKSVYNVMLKMVQDEPKDLDGDKRCQT